MNGSKCRDASETACMAAEAARAVTSENMAAFHAGEAAAAAAAVAGWSFWSRKADARSGAFCREGGAARV